MNHTCTIRLTIFFFDPFAFNKLSPEFTIQLGLIEIKSAFKNETIFCGFIKDLSAEEEHEKEHQLKERLMTGLIEGKFLFTPYVSMTGSQRGLLPY